MTEYSLVTYGINDIQTRPVRREDVRKDVLTMAERARAAGASVTIDWSRMRPSRGWARHIRRVKARTAS